MKVHAIQSELHWHDSVANRAHFEQIIEGLSDSDMIVLPEMFTTGFTKSAELMAETMEGPSVLWMSSMAAKKGALVLGSLIIRAEGDSMNRLIAAYPDGKVAHYDKRHLFRMAGEHEQFRSGDDRVIISWKGWRIMLQICYDLRFPVWSRNRFQNGDYEYDVLVYVANWPSPRHNAWETLLRARAMENLCPVVGVNRVGDDDNGLSYLGGTVILDHLGHSLSAASDGPEVIHTNLDKPSLERFRAKFPTGLDAESFTLTI